MPPPALSRTGLQDGPWWALDWRVGSRWQGYNYKRRQPDEREGNRTESAWPSSSSSYSLPSYQTSASHLPPCCCCLPLILCSSHPKLHLLLQSLVRFVPCTHIFVLREAGSLHAPCVADTPDVLLEDIFLRLPADADLARASAACPSFRRVIAGHAFLRRYRALHPPPLIAILHDHIPFVPAQPPHPAAVAARAFSGFDFSCSSFLPSTAGRTWSPVDFFDGRALLAGVPIGKGSGFKVYRDFLARDLAVCDPVHRRYIVLPAVPQDLKALVHIRDIFDMETFLAPGEHEEDPLSFRVICLAQCGINLLLLVFSSLDGQWHVLTYDQWGVRDTLAPFLNSELGQSTRQFVHGCFYCHLHKRYELIVFDVRAMEFSVIRLQSDKLYSKSFVLVEAAKGMLGMLTICNGYDKDSPWSSQEKLKCGFFTVDLKTLQVELFAALSKYLPGRLYAGFPPSLCAPTI